MSSGETALMFGEGNALFGVYHAPAGPARDRAVVFCAPFAEEKKCSYRTFAEAARAFAAAGVPCFRFDYFGTGDSAGRFEEFAPSRAVRDIVSAADRARELSGAARVILLGLRLGGTLALSAAPAAGADAVILWQPVVSGKAFFDLNIRRQVLRQQLIASADPAGKCSSVRTDGHSSGVIDLDGYPLSRAAADEIRALDCLAAANAFGGPVHLLQISHTETLSREYQPLADALGPRLTSAAVRCEPFWNRIDLTDTFAVIQKTQTWL